MNFNQRSLKVPVSLDVPPPLTSSDTDTDEEEDDSEDEDDSGALYFVLTDFTKICLYC